MGLLTAAFMPVNLVVTVLLILVVLYWLMVIIGALDIDLFDFDLDADVDADVDVDVDADVAGGGFLRGFLDFLYIGEVPIMILFSILILCMWMISMAANQLLNPMGSMLIGFPIFFGNLFVSVFITKVLFMPFKNLIKSFNEDGNATKQVIGRICVVTTTLVSDKMGQAEMSSKGAPVLLNVVAEGEHVFHKGDEAVVTGKNSVNGVYTIAPVDLEK